MQKRATKNIQGLGHLSHEEGINKTYVEILGFLKKKTMKSYKDRYAKLCMKPNILGCAMEFVSQSKIIWTPPVLSNAHFKN